MSNAILPALTKRPRPVVLAILDGWGCRDELESNAIKQAHTPNWDMLSSRFPYGTLNASAEDVGLPCGQMGNSEVGHMSIGAGRIVLQDLPRIDKAVQEQTIPSLTAFKEFVASVKQGSGTCHLMGLASDGGVHAHLSHIIALADMLHDAGLKVIIHAFLDGRDTAPKSALEFISELEKKIAGKATIGTVSGRYYAMDRDKRWDRVQKAYDAIVSAKGEQAETPAAAIHASYANGKSDEFVLPCIISDYAGMQDGDGLLMANFRADRARQLLTAMVDPEFNGFARSSTPTFSARLGMVEYSNALNVHLSALFPPEITEDTLGEIIANNGLRQLRIAETEKYAHVTFFFNAGKEQELAGEDRILVPSPNVATYDLQPEMSAYEVTEKLEAAIHAGTYDFIAVNYANADMVGHTGDMKAAVKAVEAVDSCIGRLQKAIFAAGGILLITADHGNIEQLHDHGTGQAHTAHTLNLVPFVVAGKEWEGHTISLPEGKLCDVAPTLLHLLNLPQPKTMTGTSRLESYLA